MTTILDIRDWHHEEKGMGIATIFANVSCRDLHTSRSWYEKLLGAQPVREKDDQAEWQLTDSAEVQLAQRPEHAGHSQLVLGVLPLEPEHRRLLAAGLTPGPIEETDDYFTFRLRDPDNNIIVLASARRE